MSNLEGVTVPSEIREDEKGYFHVLFITSKPNPKTLKFDHEVLPQVINKETFDRCKETYNQLGYTNMVIYHNPLVQAKTDAEAKAKSDAEAIENAKKQAQINLQNEADAEAKKNAQIDADKKAEVDSQKEDGKLLFGETEINTKNVVEFATEKGIDISKGKNLQEKLAIVSIWIETTK